MQAAAAPPLPPPRRRVYTAVDPWCEWTSTEDADTLAVDVSGFRKEELKVLYSTRRKLKVTGERQAGGVPKLKVTGERQVDGGQWARFLKVFPVPRSCDAGIIQAKLNTESARLFVILPKASSASKDRQKEHHPERAQSLQELMAAETEDGSSGSSGGTMWSAQEDLGNGKAEDKEQKQDHQAMEEPRQDQVMNIQDFPRGGGDAIKNAIKNDDATENAIKNDDAEDKEQKQDHQAMEEPRQDQVMNIQDFPRGGGDAIKNAIKNDDATENAIKNDDADGNGKGEDKRWWRKITVLHVLGFVLVLALVGVGATLLYIVLL